MGRILVVEDEPAIAELIRLNLRFDGHEAVVVYNADDAQHSVRETLPDLVVLDWMLPGESGVMLARRWRGEARTRELPIIMLTARAEERDLIQGLDAGADDYLTKPFSPGELLARIRAVLRRKSPQALETVLTVGPLRLDPATRRVHHCPEGAVGVASATAMTELTLGPTEFRLLRFLMTYPERVHSRAQLLDRVWGDHVFIEERTVDVHIKRLRAALAPAGCGDLIETVRGAGYRMVQTMPPSGPPSSTLVVMSRDSAGAGTS